jgi:hypothetical protein
MDNYQLVFTYQIGFLLTEVGFGFSKEELTRTSSWLNTMAMQS